MLSGLNELMVCEAYKYRGKKFNDFPADIDVLRECTPVYRAVKGWKENICGVDSFAKLPSNTKKYLDMITKISGVPVSMFSVGPDRDQTVITDKRLWV